MRTEQILDGHRWCRVARSSWTDPLDPSHAQRRGGRWNPPDSWPTLYLNEDIVTARMNTGRFVSGWPYEAEDLRPENGPHLVVLTLPRNQRVADVHTPAGVRSVGLPATYPLDCRNRVVPHGRCTPIGRAAKGDGLRGVRSRSVPSPGGAGRELAWFPATRRSRALLVERLVFERWFWS